MHCKIVCAGKLKDGFYIDAAKEYQKRLARFGTVQVIEVADERTPETLSPAEARKAVEREGDRLLNALDREDFVVCLCIDGRRMDSIAFASFLKDVWETRARSIAFVIGGSLGLSSAALARADLKLSISDMTLPHRLCRVFLLEQIYRACKINANEPYHK